jgi:hypothetical protein
LKIASLLPEGEGQDEGVNKLYFYPLSPTLSRREREDVNAQNLRIIL